MCIELVMPSSHLILCHPLLLLPPIPPSISLFQWDNSLHEVDKVLEFQLQHQSFQWAQTVEGQRFLLKDGLPWFTHFYIYMYNSKMFNLEPLRTKWPFIHLSNTESAATMSKDAINTRDHLKLMTLLTGYTAIQNKKSNKEQREERGIRHVISPSVV